MRRTLGDVLALNGYTPRTAGTGRAALDLADRSSFPAAIIDLRLPDIDGLDVAAELRERDERTQVIILTGHASIESVVRAVRDQGCDYLVKPVAPEDLVRSVRAAVDRWLRQAAEDHLRQTESMLKALFEASPLPLVVFDSKLAVRLWNRAAERIFGWSLEEVQGRELEAVDALSDTDVRRHLEKVLAGGAVTGSELRQRRRDGLLLDTRLSAAAVTDRTGVSSAVLAVFEDITEQLRIEAHLSHVQRIDALGRLAGGIAHDFNNLLAVIRTEVDLALDEGGTPETFRRTLEVVHEASDRGAALTRQLLSFSRSDPVESRVVEANLVVAGLERMLRPLLPEPLELEVELEDRVGHVNVDTRQLEQVLTNLVLNARDAIDGPGRITVSTRSHDVTSQGSQLGLDSGAWVVISVADTGSGIPEAYLPRIFEPFFTTKSAESGTGLGLATSYAVVQRMGGLIDVETAPGRGSTFHVCLPRSRAPAPADEAASPDATPTGSETVLLVEDDADLRDVTRRLLLRQGYSVISASDGDEARGAVSMLGRAPDLLLCDAHLPTGDGLDLIADLQVRYPGLRALLTSGSFGRGARSEFPVPFVEKPYDLDGLARAVRSALDTPPAGRDASP